MANRVFFVVSTGRCGTKFLAHLLDLAPDAHVVHEPEPGLEFVNSYGYCMYFHDRNRFFGHGVLDVRPPCRKGYYGIDVEDITPLKKHLDNYLTVDSDVYGGCHNSLAPFAYAAHQYFLRQGICCKIVHLVRDPFMCCRSLLRMEGPNGYGRYRVGFNLRSSCLYAESDTPEEQVVSIWRNINDVIAAQTHAIEQESPGASTLVRLEDLGNTPLLEDLYSFLGLQYPDEESIAAALTDESYSVRHSHSDMLDSQCIPDLDAAQSARLLDLTTGLRIKYGYSTPSPPTEERDML